MPSIARITKQYAKTKQRGGGLFGIGDDKPAEAQAATPAVTPAATPAQPAAEPKSAEPTASQEPSFLDKIFKPTPEDKDAQIVPEGKTTEPGAAAVAEPLETEAEETADASADGEKQGKDESALDKLKKLFIGNKKEDEESEESESEESGSEESGSEESGSEESGSENAVPASAAALTAAAATTATANVISESESGSDASDDEQDELTFKNFEREIQTLRDKYDKLKEENRRLKSEKKDESNGKKDNSEFSKIIASFFAIEGSVAQLKLSLKKHADQNGFPVDGLGLDDAESVSTPAPEPEPEPVAAPETEVPLPQDNNAALAAGAGAATAMAAAPIVADQLAATSTEASAEMPAAGIPNEMMNNAPEAAPAIPELDSSSESGSESGSESDLEEIPVNQEQDQSAATTEAAGAADITGMPAALEQPVVGESMPAEPATAPVATAASGPSPVPAPGATDANNGLFSGGKNHYLQSMKKNKTHRHHKRRNRHQTLRK
jgi:hypothetical protein